MSFIYNFLRAFPYFIWTSILGMAGPFVGRSASNPKPDTSVSSAPLVNKAGSSMAEDIRASVRKEIGEQVETKPEPEDVAVTSEKTSSEVETAKVDEPEKPEVVEAPVAEEAPVEPKAAKATSAGEDLKRIKGIGAVLEKELIALGINSYEQIANLTVEDLAEARMKLTIMQRAKKDDWLEQAALLAAGESTEFSERVDAGKVPSSNNNSDDKDER